MAAALATVAAVAAVAFPFAPPVLGGRAGVPHLSLSMLLAKGTSRASSSGCLVARNENKIQEDPDVSRIDPITVAAVKKNQGRRFQWIDRMGGVVSRVNPISHFLKGLSLCGAASNAPRKLAAQQSVQAQTGRSRCSFKSRTTIKRTNRIGVFHCGHPSR